MANWCSVIPLHFLEFDYDQPLAFADNLTLSPLPVWLKEDKLTHHLDIWDRQALNRVTHGFVAEYDASGLGAPDPSWKGKQPKSIQENKYELAVLANLALWLSRPSPACFEFVFHASQIQGNWGVHQCEKPSPLLCHPKDVDSRIVFDDIQRAANLHLALNNLARESAMWTAVRSTWAALQMNMGEVRYLLFWVALEALFGPEDAREITYRLAQRIALFLGSDKSAARNYFTIAKNGYSFRSQMVHGRWRSNPKSNELMYTAESLIRQSLVKILSDKVLTGRFLRKDRESYLDDLVFAN